MPRRKDGISTIALILFLILTLFLALILFLSLTPPCVGYSFLTKGRRNDGISTIALILFLILTLFLALIPLCVENPLMIDAKAARWNQHNRSHSVSPSHSPWHRMSIMGHQAPPWVSRAEFEVIIPFRSKIEAGFGWLFSR